MASDWIELFNGTDLTGWEPRTADREARPHNWSVEDGLLKTAGKGLDLLTADEFGDFELHIEYNMLPDSNSGIYLRGRYEIQMLDSHGKTYENPSENGSLYLVKKPDVEVTKPAGEWQWLDVILVGLRLTASLNGHTIHEGIGIEGPTGSNWVVKDNAPRGPHFLQGDHGPAHFRNIRIRNL
ncbi:MAG: DUF1080 domain-containing protein [Candidatus Poribacteria bacterium]